MALIDPYTGGQDVEREAVLFAVLRERVRPAEASVARADEEISAWLDEAEEEGARILEQARADAAREAAAVRTQVHSLRQDIVGLLDRVDALLPVLDEAAGRRAAPRLVLLPGDRPPARRRRWERLLRRR